MEKVKAASLLQFQDLISEVIKKVNHVHLPLTQLYSEGKFDRVPLPWHTGHTVVS